MDIVLQIYRYIWTGLMRWSEEIFFPMVYIRLDFTVWYIIFIQFSGLIRMRFCVCSILYRYSLFIWYFLLWWNCYADHCICHMQECLYIYWEISGQNRHIVVLGHHCHRNSEWFLWFRLFTSWSVFFRQRRRNWKPEKQSCFQDALRWLLRWLWRFIFMELWLQGFAVLELLSVFVRASWIKSILNELWWLVLSVYFWLCFLWGLHLQEGHLCRAHLAGD